MGISDTNILMQSVMDTLTIFYAHYEFDESGNVCPKDKSIRLYIKRNRVCTKKRSNPNRRVKKKGKRKNRR